MFISYQKFNYLIGKILRYCIDNNIGITKVPSQNDLLKSNLCKDRNDAKKIKMLYQSKFNGDFIETTDIIKTLIFLHFDEYKPIWQNMIGNAECFTDTKRKHRIEKFINFITY